MHNTFDTEPVIDRSFYTRIADYLSNLLAEVESEPRAKSAPKGTRSEDAAPYGWHTVAFRRR